MNDTTIVLEIFIVVLLLSINYIIELCSTSLENVNLNVIKGMVEEVGEMDCHNQKTKRLSLLLESPSKYYYCNLLIQTISYILIGFILISNIPVSYECCDFEISKTLYLIISYIIVAIIIISVCRFLPHKIALQHSEKKALKWINFQYTLCIITKPFVKVLMIFTNIILKAFKQETKINDNAFSEDDVMSMLEVGQESGAIKEEGKRMINSIFAFDDELAYEIMTPRTNVFMIDINDSPEEYIEELMSLRYSRIPVYDDDPDNIIGILNIKDYLIKARNQGFENIEIKDILRQAYFVPETKNIDSLFVELQKTRQQIAILIDEYGGFSGIVTMEDIIEEVMGDIDDEYDLEDNDIRQIGDKEYILNGSVSIDDLDEELGINIESESSETISGFLIDLIGDIPEENAKKKVVFENYEFLIISVKERRIEKIKLTIL